jgi:nitrogen fixation NifU-like protein
MPDLRELYQQVILDHHKRPRNFRKMDEANKSAEGYNPLCGDRLNLYLKIEDGIVKDIAFQGSGCAISTASASMMTESLKGKTEAEARALFERFHELVAGNGERTQDQSGLGKLEVFSGVRDYPVRIKCAVLCWHTLKAALDDSKETVETE